MGILLAALASLCFVTLDVLRKLLGPRLSAVDIVIGINLGAAVVFGLLLASYDSHSFDVTFLVLAAVESVTYTIASLLYVRAVTVSPLSLTVPYLAFTPVVAALTALLVLGETPSWTGLLGISLVVTGAVALHTGTERNIGRLFTAPFREPGSWMMLLVALIWGTTTSIDKVAIRHGSEVLLAFSLTVGSSLILLAVRTLKPAREVESSEFGRQSRLALLALASLAAAAAVLCQFYAYRELLVAYVETIKRAGGLASLLIGVFCFKEGGFANRFPAAALMLTGIALIMLR